jgi:branched-chain amino acid transport system substrate-binding protein
MIRHEDVQVVRRSKRTWLAVALTAFVATFGLAACGSDDKSSANAGGGGGGNDAAANAQTPLNEIFGPGGKAGGSEVTMKTGMLLAMTGPGAYFGRVMSGGAKLAAAQIKAAGGPSFDIVTKDHQNGQVQAGVAATRQMFTQDKVDWLQTSYGAVSEAIIPLLQQNKKLTFNGGGTSPGQVGKDLLWNNRMVFAEDPAPGNLAYLAKAYPDAKRLVIIGTEENGVRAIKEIVPQDWPKVATGGQVAATEIVDAGLTNFGPTIARIKAAKPDVIWGALFGNDPGYFVKQLRQAGVTVPFLNTEYTADACKVAGKSYDTFTFGHDYFDPTSENPWAQIFVKGFKEAMGETPDFYAANYYEQEFVMWELIRRVLKNGGDPKNSEDLQKALLQNTKFPSVYAGGPGKVGEMTFDPKNHTIEKPMGVFKVKDCQPQQVATIKLVKPGEDPKTALVEMTEAK